jgi:L-glyceraldehyde 3-phosphate reductase
MAAILRELGTPCLIHQPKYNLFERSPEQGLLEVLLQEGIGGIAFCPLAQGLLTNRYLSGIPADARAARDPRFLNPGQITGDKIARIRSIEAIALKRGQSLAQMALAWVLRQPAITSALIGASKPAQIEENVAAVKTLNFSPEELAQIEKCLAGSGS